MLKNNLEFQNLQILAASAIPFVAMLITQIISPIWRLVAENEPGNHAHLTLPSGPQSTAYLVSFPQQRR